MITKKWVRQSISPEDIRFFSLFLHKPPKKTNYFWRIQKNRFLRGLEPKIEKNEFHHAKNQKICHRMTYFKTFLDRPKPLENPFFWKKKFRKFLKIFRNFFFKKMDFWGVGDGLKTFWNRSLCGKKSEFSRGGIRFLIFFSKFFRI